jgi:hypothetical protein
MLAHQPALEPTIRAQVLSEVLACPACLALGSGAGLRRVALLHGPRLVGQFVAEEIPHDFALLLHAMLFQQRGPLSGW